MNLDFYQKQAAFQNHPYSVIIAGAGTGKTFTLLGRIQYLVTNMNLKPEEILVISFTNETVKDFQSKLKKYFNYNISVLTFHKLAIYLLQNSYFDFSIMNPQNIDYVIDEFFYGFVANSSYLKSIVLSIIPFFQKIKIKNFSEFFKTNFFIELKKNLTFFIKMSLAYGYTANYLYNCYLSAPKRYKNFILLSIILFSFYEHEKESQKLLDFDDLIKFAIDKISDIKVFPFKHILVDEFQDSSYIRIQLLKRLVNKFQLNFTLVGDDYQSIYRFSGTKSDCFETIKNFFPNTKFFYLQNTYRNSQELVSIASSFIQKNPLQVKKEIFSAHHLKFPIEIFYYKNPKKIYIMLEKILLSTHGSILFLARNSFDWKYYFDENEITWHNNHCFSLKKIPQRQFQFMTVHKSKGLEADNVILLHLEKCTYGFPNLITYPKYFLNIFYRENIPFEEERRLFYVALTRTKNKIYLLAPLSNPSQFIMELRRDYKRKIKIIYF